MRVPKILSPAALLALALAACDETPVSLPEPTSVSVTATDLRLTVGDVAPVPAQVLDQQGRVLAGITPVFTSDDPSVATVDAGGTVRALSPGSANITAAYGSAKATAKVTVARDERGFVRSLDVLADSLAFDVRAGTQVVALRAFNGYGQSVCPTVSVRSTDASVATATSAGGCRVNIVPAFPGVATIVVSADGMVDSVRVRVASNNATAFISRRPAVAEMFAGNTVTYAARLIDEAGNPLAGRAVNVDVTGGALSATTVTTDATGTATVQWTLPTNLQVLGNVQSISFRAQLPNGTVGSASEQVVVNGGPIVDLAFFRRDFFTFPFNFTRIDGPTLTVRTFVSTDVGVRGVDQYGNVRTENFTFAITPPAFLQCGTEGFTTVDGIEYSCFTSTTPGTATFTATAGSITRSIDVVFVD